MKQFSLFAWTHVALLIVVTQSYLIIQNIFEGLIWYVFTSSIRTVTTIYLLTYIHIDVLYQLYQLSLGSLSLLV